MSTAPINETLQSEDVPVSLTFELTMEQTSEGRMALLAYSHTVIEHRLYMAMQTMAVESQRQHLVLSVRRLVTLSGLRSHGSVRRGCAGLVRKLSIESFPGSESRRGTKFRIFNPDQIFSRRREADLEPFPAFLAGHKRDSSFDRLIQSTAGREDLSRREGLVVLCCTEGLSNAQIGKRLRISEQTVKSHLRQIFSKFNVKRRAELVSLLLRDGSAESSKEVSRSPGETPGLISLPASV